LADLEQVQGLAAAGWSMSEAARMLSISRARVHQIAKKHDIKFRNGRIGVVRKQPAVRRLPDPRIDVGGPPVLITASVAGKCAEMLVAADLLARGWQVFLPVFSNRGHDLCAYVPGHLVSIEVRSARRSQTGNIVFSKRVTDYSMYYALVIRGEVIKYVPELPAKWVQMPDGSRGTEIEYEQATLID
jgi:hypothetical protein